MSMVDYPGKLAATVFTGGCNLRCPFCHNAILVTEVDENEVIPEKEVFEFLKSRQGLLDGVVISGGEPLLYDDITNFAESVKELNFTVKLDTNGFFPEKLNKLLSCGNIDYVAMDIKNSKDKYSMTTGIPDIDISPVEESVEIIKNTALIKPIAIDNAITSELAPTAVPVIGPTI